MGMVPSGLTQGDVVARLVVRPRSTFNLNSRENLLGILQQELDIEEPSTSIQQPTEQLKSARAKIGGNAGAYCVERAESVAKSVALSGELI